MTIPKKPNSALRVLAIGDIVARPGRTVLKENLAKMKLMHEIDFVVVNAENAAGGFGPTPAIANEVYESGTDVISLGDHVWDRKEFADFLDKNTQRCVRPINYPAGAPGKGYTIFTTKSGQKIAVVNAIGRIFMNMVLDCPFKALDQLLNNELKEIKFIICDFHAEASSEKVAMGWYLDGRASLVFGTHTHVPTADYRVLPKGTAYVTDLGMSGCLDSVIGMRKELAIERFVTGLSVSYDAAMGPGTLNGVVCDLALETGRAVGIYRI